MKFIQGKPRNQWELYCLDEHVDTDNEVRLIDLFVNSLNLAELGFKTQYEENGRPAYHPGALLRLFIYGYLNRIRSSRQLEKECKRNLELMWLGKWLVVSTHGFIKKRSKVPDNEIQKAVNIRTKYLAAKQVKNKKK